MNYKIYNVDVFGKAVLDYQLGNYDEDILTFSSLVEQDSIPLPYLFRGFDTMPPLEQKALGLCRGTILDIGCGAGSHSLYLQEKGMAVTALDSSKGAIKTCRLRGIKTTVCKDVYAYNEAKFDTLLLLMNGIGLAGKITNLNRFFGHLKSLLKPDGQILVDSSDIIYMFQQDEDGGYWIPDTDKYYGEVDFVITYKGLKSNSFPWLYLDYNTFKKEALNNNLTCEIVSLGGHYDYLAKLLLKG
ncbi:MAG: class I SAM-dependent methyltransferase [Bacteroidota bacterium]